MVALSEPKVSDVVVTMEEVARHDKEDDCWIVINGKVYDVTDWLEKHPGTKYPILDAAGTDATEIFEHLHGVDILPKFGTPYLIGSVEEKSYAESKRRKRERDADTDISRELPENHIVDFVVVGAGSAGCLVANRLSSAGHSVLLLEAGDSLTEDLTENVSDPMKYGAAFATTLNWGFATIEQKFAGNRHIRCTRGRGVGGTSLVNGMLFNRGAKEIYNAWEKLGAFGWSADDMLKYFKKYEDNSRGSSLTHGSGGNVRVSDIPAAQLSPIATMFHNACVMAGFPANPDQNSLIGPQYGVQIYQCYIRDDNGHRVTASRAFLRDAEELPLTIRPNSYVSEIQLSTSDSSCKHNAFGVKFLDKNGKEYQAFAKHEVIISGGVINSPQILMLSGIGPSQHLKKVGIKPKVDLPGVGENLVDHPRVACKWASKLKGLNPMDCFSHVEANLYAHSPWNVGPPDIQIQQDHVRTNSDLLLDPPVSTGFNLKPHCVVPYSRGQVRLKSKNPRDKPLIDPKYLSDKRDLECIVEGIKICRKVVDQKAFDGIRGEELQPGPKIQSDEELRDWVIANVDTGYHPVGTCRIGNKQDSLAVVDPELKVFGVSNLRVVDASVMPVIPNGNTQAATFAVAEKASEMILHAAAKREARGKVIDFLGTVPTNAYAKVTNALIN